MPLSDKNLILFDSLTGKKKKFIPVDSKHIKMYVCGPTVYNIPHIGNGRSAVVFDLLFRLLKHKYRKVTYVRNITDVDDKIIKTANEKNITPKKLTGEMIKRYERDVSILGCLTPSSQPKVTENIQQIIQFIKLLLEKQVAYEIEGHVFFDTTKHKEYGILSKRITKQEQQGTRITIQNIKRHPTDFVLWKPTKIDEEKLYFESPWSAGRPGWHIECSSIVNKFLGNEIDIHGGGIDLLFPHHENELAQSIAHSPSSKFVRYWLHNGMVIMKNKKMSKSIGNIINIEDIANNILDGAILRYLYLTTHYRKPIYYTEKSLQDAKKAIYKFYKKIEGIEQSNKISRNAESHIEILYNDMNTPALFAKLHELADSDKAEKLEILYQLLSFLGINFEYNNITIPEEILKLGRERQSAKKEKKWDRADEIRELIISKGYNIIDLGAEEFKIEKRAISSDG